MTEREIAFLRYWEANRLKEKKWQYQLLIGIPIGLLFSLPIIIIVFTGRYWYVRADMEANASLSPTLLIICVVIIAIFIAIFYKRHQWDMKEQQYQELRAKEMREKEAESGTGPVQQ
jgi:membrane protein YdbS with pleckstrin-like domain